MAGSRERLLYADERARYAPRYTSGHASGYERPLRRKNGYVYEDVYSDAAYDDAQRGLSLFRPIRPEYLHLPAAHDKYASPPARYDDYPRRYRRDYYDFRIERRERRQKIELNEINYQSRRTAQHRPDGDLPVCRELRLARTERPARYWTTDSAEPPGRRRPRPGAVTKKNVKFSEVSGCNRKTVIVDPVCGRRLVPVRELEVSLDQMIQNGYFEKLNIPVNMANLKITENGAKIVKNESESSEQVPNGKCLSGQATEQASDTPPQRHTRYTPQKKMLSTNNIKIHVHGARSALTSDRRSPPAVESTHRINCPTCRRLLSTAKARYDLLPVFRMIFIPKHAIIIYIGQVRTGLVFEGSA
ncbi:hypothetical protein EVAR_86121_1 [Eumeta japonica]|uniref:Uncharacterized protein n=1 Tax=Eumeta variegata TaxID=151549 RepID=A0A4C1V1A2_EUMVA|nr:hypothetical protein EVAR_86121_1 [Eumeta japonica]